MHVSLLTASSSGVSFSMGVSRSTSGVPLSPGTVAFDLGVNGDILALCYGVDRKVCLCLENDVRAR